ncbi:MAG: SAM hydroxide adenosyltransferase [Alphaproteobacteria bacterium]
MEIPYQRVSIEGGIVTGGIPVLDPQYGNIWTSIPSKAVASSGYKYGDVFKVKIMKNKDVIYQGNIPYVRTFASVKKR